MLLTIQYPFADCRPILGLSTDSIGLSSWPLPQADIDFIRGFGTVRKRPRGGLVGWVGENLMCDASRALRTPGLPRRLPRQKNEAAPSFSIESSFRRFFSDGFALAKYEAGLSMELRSHTSQEGSIDQAFQDLLDIKATVYVGSSERQECRLGSAGKPLARNFLLSTTASQNPTALEKSDWRVQAGVPLLFLEREHTEYFDVPYKITTIQIERKLGLKLSFCRIPWKTGQRQLPFWIIDSMGRPQARTARALRMCLLRLHAECESLRLVLRNLAAAHLKPAPKTSDSDLLQKYLRNATRRITGLGKQADQITDTEFASLARQSRNLVDPGEQDALLAAINNLDFRKNIFRKVKEYITNNTYNMGDQINITGGAQTSVGRNATFSNNSISQWAQSQNTQSLEILGEELSRLRAEMKRVSTEPEHDTAIGLVAQAETAAKSGDGNKVLDLLRQAGAWTLSLAEKIAVPVAVEALKRSAGL